MLCAFLERPQKGELLLRVVANAFVGRLELALRDVAECAGQALAFRLDRFGYEYSEQNGI